MNSVKWCHHHAAIKPWGQSQSDAVRPQCFNLYRAVLLTTLLCGAESYGSHIDRHLHLFERYHQPAILNIHWSDFVTNIEVLEMAKVTSIEAMLLKTQLRWAGHVSRMEDHRLPKIEL